MSEITGTRNVLAVKDLKRSASFYMQKMGFKTLWEGGGWHFLVRDEMKIMLGECPDDLAASETGSHSYCAYAEVNRADELYHEYNSAGIVLSQIENKPWGQREFSVRTVDGHRIMFGESIIPG